MTTVFTDGVFDLFHANHMRLLHTARAMGDRLIVGVTSDDDAASYKRRPILTQDERIDTIRASGIADEVILGPRLSDGITADFLDTHAIDLVVYASDGWADYFRIPIERGIFRRLPYGEGISSTEIIGRIRSRG